jgi:hypothetical protein
LSAPFTEAELAFLKRRLEVQFGEAPRARDGIVLKTWKSGPEKGKPKLPDAVKSLMERNLVAVISDGRQFPIAVFTSDGLEVLRNAMLMENVFPLSRFAHLRDELSTSQDGSLCG